MIEILKGFLKGFYKGHNKGLGYRGLNTADDLRPTLPAIRNIPYFPYFRVLKVMQDLNYRLNPKP